MINSYTCEKCRNIFSQKSHFINHTNRKTHCKPINNYIIEEIVSEKLKELKNEELKNEELKNEELKNEELKNEELKNEELKNEELKNEKKNIKTNNTNITMDIQNKDGIEYISTIADNSINLILTDPPYITSSETGMGNLFKKIQDNKKKGIENMKTEEEWESVKHKYIGKKKIKEETMKQNYIKYGSIYGSKYSVQTEYGDWDTTFTMEILDKFIQEYYKKLKKGGTIIIFFDIWKITTLKKLLEKNKFKQIRFIEWIKTNPQPLNSKTNYLTNCREIALLGVKGGKPTFNSSYDNAIYQYPLQGGKSRFHPTQKSLLLFEELIRKHSNEGDIILDTFLGSGTTALACKNTKRNFMGCEISEEYYKKIIKIIE